tara:strand:- start:7080 stop:7556 length:477 start_codon:yes stop_codon:yes gene_type:complete
MSSPKIVETLVVTEIHDKHRSSPSELSNDSQILLAEDHEVNQLVAVTMLEMLGYTNVDIVENGEDAIQRLQEKKYDIVLMDIRMPICDGIEASRRIRQNFNYTNKVSASFDSNIPIIALTANSSKEDIEACLEAGMNGYISKPLDMKQLEDEIRKWVK